MTEKHFYLSDNETIEISLHNDNYTVVFIHHDGEYDNADRRTILQDVDYETIKQVLFDDYGIIS